MTRVRMEFLDNFFPCGIDRLIRKNANSISAGLNINDTRTSLLSLVPRGSVSQSLAVVGLRRLCRPDPLVCAFGHSALSRTFGCMLT